MGGRIQSTSIDVSHPAGAGSEEGGLRTTPLRRHTGGRAVYVALLVSFMFIHFVS